MFHFLWAHWAHCGIFVSAVCSLFPKAIFFDVYKIIGWIIETVKSRSKRSVLCKNNDKKEGKGKIQGVPQLQTAALPRHQEEEETDKTKQAKSNKRKKH